MLLLYENSLQKKINDNIIIIIIIQFKFTEENPWIQYCAKDACMHAKSLSGVWLCVTLWIVARQAPLSMEFSGQEHWSVYPFPFLGDLLDPGIKPGSPALQAGSLPSEPPGKLWF